MIHHMPYASVNGVQLAYEVHSGEGDVVLLLGGTGMPGAAWTLNLVPALCDTGYRPVTVDGRGVGASDSPPGPYTIGLLADDVAGLIDQLGVGPSHLVGLSQGGFVAELLSSTKPELVRTATLLGCAGATTSFTRAWAQAWRDLLHVAPELPSSLLVLEDLLGLPERTLRDDDATVDEWASLLASTPSTGAALHSQIGACLEWLLERDHASYWPDMTPPCLVLSFEHDVRWPPRAGEHAAAAMRNGEFRMIPGVGHTNGLFDAAAEVSAAVLEFLGAHT